MQERSSQTGINEKKNPKNFHNQMFLRLHIPSNLKQYRIHSSSNNDLAIRFSSKDQWTHLAMFFSWPRCCYRQVWWEQSAFERWPSTKPRLESQTGSHWKAKDNFQCSNSTFSQVAYVSFFLFFSRPLLFISSPIRIRYEQQQVVKICVV